MRRTWLRITGAVVAAPIAVTAGQMYFIRAKFKLPPDAEGPLEGVELAPTAVKPSWFASLGWTHQARPRRNIVFLGDSIVTGVGCSPEACRENGPILPRRVASLLAEHLGVDVGWAALGETGADVHSMRDRLLPSLQEAQQKMQSSGEGRVDAVIILTGCNDLKECFLFAKPHTHHPWAFFQHLTSLLGTICDVAGDPVAVLVAGTPFDAVPRFNKFWPFSIAINRTVAIWEDQKEMAVTAAQALRDEQAVARAKALPPQPTQPTQPNKQQKSGSSIAFVPPPPGMVERLLDGADYFAADGMHPNDTGYAIWADVIAERLIREFQGMGLSHSE